MPPNRGLLFPLLCVVMAWTTSTNQSQVSERSGPMRELHSAPGQCRGRRDPGPLWEGRGQAGPAGLEAGQAGQEGGGENQAARPALQEHQVRPVSRLQRAPQQGDEGVEM